MVSENHGVTCKSCTKYIYCWERSRDYPCRSYDNMYSPKKGGKELRMNDRRSLRHNLHADSSGSTHDSTDMADIKETAEERLRNHVTVLLCKGAEPALIKREIQQDKTCTAIVKLRLLEELHFERRRTT